MMQKKKITGRIISKEYQIKSRNFKLEIITFDKQKLFFYTQQKYQGTSTTLEVNEKYLFCLFKDKKYWFLENCEKDLLSEKASNLLNQRKAELSEFSLNNLKKQSELKTFQQLEKKLTNLREQISKIGDDEELIFLEHFEEFINLLLIKQLSIKENQKLTEKEQRERRILDKIVANWFYKT